MKTKVYSLINNSAKTHIGRLVIGENYMTTILFNALDLNLIPINFHEEYKTNNKLEWDTQKTIDVFSYYVSDYMKDKAQTKLDNPNCSHIDILRYILENENLPFKIIDITKKIDTIQQRIERRSKVTGFNKLNIFNVCFGDLHGNFDILEKAIKELSLETELSVEYLRTKTILLGDLFDRIEGTHEEIDSKIDKFLKYNYTSCLGNHDIMLKIYMMNEPIKEIPYFANVEDTLQIWTRENNGGDIVKQYVNRIKESNPERYEQLYNYVMGLKEHILLKEQKTILTHSLIPSGIDYWFNIDKTKGIEYYLDKTNLTDKIWTSYEEINQFFATKDYTDDYIPTDIKEYNYITGHYSAIGLVKHRNLYVCDTGAYKTGLLSGVIITTKGEILPIVYDDETNRISFMLDEEISVKSSVTD